MCRRTARSRSRRASDAGRDRRDSACGHNGMSHVMLFGHRRGVPRLRQHRRLRRQPLGVELVQQLARPPHARAPTRQAQRVGEQRQRRADRLVTIGERRRAMALGQPRPVGAEYEWHVGVARGRQPEQPCQQDLARRRVGQVGAADDLADALRRVVDDDRELIRRDAVGPADDEVVDDRRALAEQPVGERNELAIGAQPQRVLLARQRSAAPVRRPTAPGRCPRRRPPRDRAAPERPRGSRPACRSTGTAARRA